MKRLSILALFLVLTLVTCKNRAQEEPDMENFDNYDFLLQNAEQRQEKIKELECSTFSLLQDLLNPTFNVLNILKKHSLYKRSNSILDRSVHDLPTFTWTCVDNGCLTLAMLPFYNQTSKMFFTKDSPYISSYTNLTNPELIKDLSAIVTDLLNIPVGEILPLFSHIKLQERRAGLFLRAGSNYGPWTFQVSWPFMYLERNFFLNNAERERLEESEFLSNLSTGTNKAEAEAFIRPHLVADKLGFGDMRLHALYTPYKSSSDRFTLGGFVTLPTAFSVKEGILGNSFCKRGGPPPLPLLELLAIGFDCEDKKSTEIASFNQAIAFAFGILDRLTANVAETSLGNNGHVTIGPLLEYAHKFNDCLAITTQANVQYVTPGNEIRSFIPKISPKAFDRDFNNPAKAVENLEFIKDVIIARTFLTPLKVKVQPGAIAQVNSYVTYAFDWLTASLGYDFWYQAQEKFKSIEHPHPSILISPAMNPAGMQHKLFGSLLGSLEHGEDGLLQLGLRWDYTFASQGMGRDFTLAANLAVLY